MTAALLEPHASSEQARTHEATYLTPVGAEPTVSAGHDGLAAAPAISSPPVYFSAPDLLEMTFPPPRWAVPDLVAEGLNLLVAPPKTGKSFLALNIAVAVASGTVALGRTEVEQGDAFVLALEDTPRRLQARLRMMLGDAPPPTRLKFGTRCKPLDEGGDAYIDSWLTAHPQARLVVVDVFAKVRSRPTRGGNAYDEDYRATGVLKDLADRHGVAVLVLHHTRKQAAEDFLESVSGTNGIAGSADALLVLSRSRTKADAMLQVTGRDIEEAEHALTFDSNRGSWSFLDRPAGDFALGDTRLQILDYLRERNGARPGVLAKDLGLKPDLVRKTLTRMASDAQIDTDGSGHYFPLPTVTGVTAVPLALEGQL